MTVHDETTRPGRGLVARLEADRLRECGDVVRFECEDALGNSTQGVAVRFEGGVVAFENICPHLGFALDCHSDSFTGPEGELLECDAHGAQFEADSGRCVAGPCEGERLEVFEVEIDEEAGEVLVRRGARLSIGSTGSTGG